MGGCRERDYSVRFRLAELQFPEALASQHSLPQGAIRQTAYTASPPWKPAEFAVQFGLNGMIS